MKIVSVSEMAAIEKKADSGGLSYAQMMRNAGGSLARIVMQRYGSANPRCALGLVGSGNNGGDTLVALALMQRAGWQTIAYLVKDRKADDALVRELAERGGKVLIHSDGENEGDLIDAIQSCSLILDGILGTGFKLPLRGNVPDVLNMVAMYAGERVLIAVDCPSGVDCDSGACAPETLKAEMTVCMAAVKQGLVKPPAIGLTGEMVLAQIGLPEDAFSGIANPILAVERTYVNSILPERPADGHKGTYGKCLVAGGSVLYPGAPTLAAEAAYRVGAGLVCTAVPSAIYESVISRLPEAIWLMLPHDMGMLSSEAANLLISQMGKYDAMVVGPGLGDEKAPEGFMHALLNTGNQQTSTRQIGFLPGSKSKQSESSQPAMVIDADGLRLLAGIDDWHQRLERTAVLTPHPGEMAALTGMAIAEIQNNRAAIAQQYAEKWGHVLVLKGALTVVAGINKEMVLIPIATSALATAGTGDVLAGMIAGLMAQGAAAFEAAVAGAWLHGMAGLYAEKQHGQGASVIASDIIALLPCVLNDITAH